MTYLRADLDHIALDCKNEPLDLVDFYVSVLGFEPYRVDAFKAGQAPFPSVRVSPMTILDFFAAKEPEAPPPQGLRQSNHFCFSIAKSEFDALRDRLEKNGVETTHPPKKRSGARGDGWSIYLEDPEGNNLEFRYYDVNAKPEQ